MTQTGSSMAYESNGELIGVAGSVYVQIEAAPFKRRGVPKIEMGIGVSEDGQSRQ